ncbi:Sulfofructose kinase [Granulosicoccus antarcticus IMCC3135]|uniref:Sulfofructose kinase n=2 Tax=Granulosicoccus TaxID=437504 RepID=A0A2Z2P1Y7_9GAMM|nr:Sulfofructose kinase [Granulosicoccus antarcticus IMCC3135]
MASGLIAADITFRVGEMPRRAEKYRAEDVRFSLGGGGAIAAVAMQRLGAEVQLAGRLGDDLFGDVLRTELLGRSVGHSLVVCIRDSKSPISSVFVDASGDRQIVNYRGADEASIAREASTVLDVQLLQALEIPEAVLVDTRWEAAALQVLSYAKQMGIPAVIDAEAPVSHAAMALASHLAFSRQGLRDFASVDSVEQGLRMAQMQFGNWVCVTDGEQGVYWLDEGKLAHMSAFAVTAVDTLGAGDVWHAAFTLQLAKRCPEQVAIEFANAAAALKCMSPDGLDGIPDEGEVLAFMKQRTGADSQI